MFSESDNTAVNYYFGSPYRLSEKNVPITLKERLAHNTLLASFMVIRQNSEEACSLKLLQDLSEEKQKEYRVNSTIGQNGLKLINDDLSKSFDACIRRSFGKIYILYVFFSPIFNKTLIINIFKYNKNIFIVSFEF
jgi:hypothetical protein